MKIAFYKSAYGGLLDRAIDDLSGTARSNYSHVEAIFSDGVWFSSVPGIGPRFSPTLPEPSDSWDMLFWPVTPQKEAEMWAWAARQIGNPSDTYDWRGDINFLVPVGDNGHKLFCSKAIVLLGQVGGFFPNVNPSDINPDVLFEIVTALGWR